ncbi:MAG: UDP-N-acetylglucosamine pyrophosphorylase [Oscillospiraceae bacterium]|nr:UDP-N-acetylglucosamine pyrophosphorylase [Oscillospiraceae bacterium]
MERIKTKNLFDLSHTIAGDFFKEFEFPWLVVPRISEFISELSNTLSKNEFEEIKEKVWVSKNAFISEHAEISGPTIIESSAEIRFGAFIRGNVIVGKNSIVGNSTELKNCILFDNAQAPHFNYIGDSILGFKSHIGAGVIISNLKSDKSDVSINFGQTKIETNLKKFGAALGDFSEVGCNAVINPGTIVGKSSVVYPLSMVRGVVESGYIMKGAGNVVKKE